MDELEARLSSRGCTTTPTVRQSCSKSATNWSQSSRLIALMSRRQQTIADATEMLSDPDMKELAQEELHAAKADVARLRTSSRSCCCPKTRTTTKIFSWKSVAARAARKVRCLRPICTACTQWYADKRGWQTEVMSASETELGGYKELCSAWRGIRCIRA